MTESTIRKYQPGDERGINQLYNTVFGVNRSLDAWRWKYDQLPRTPLKLIAVLEGAGQIVGQYSSSPLDMVYRGQTVLGTQPMDIAIQDAYRGRQLSKPLFEAWTSLARASGVAFAFGFPNPLHYKVGKNILNYPDVGPVMLLRRYVNPGLGLFKLTRLPITLSAPRRLANWVYCCLCQSQNVPIDLSIERLECFDERFDVFWSQMTSAYPIIVARTRSYLNWRYVDRTDASYTIYAAHRAGVIEGYVVLALRQQLVVQGLVADILAVNALVTQALLERAMEHFFTAEVDMVSAWALPGSKLYETLRRIGFIQRRVAAPLVAMVFDHDAIDASFLYNPRNWYVTLGDSDGV
jgi:predicted N-acetyltransferase YhbS